MSKVFPKVTCHAVFSPRLKSWLIIAGLTGAIAYAGLAAAGPPFRTDDPEPVPYGHYEAYLFSSGTQGAGGWNGVGPAIEFNDGFHRNMMVHMVLPLAYNTLDGGPRTQGMGDIELGLKARLVHQVQTGPDIGVFPLIEVPTGSAARGLGNGRAQFFLPVWAQEDFDEGRWTTYGGGGYWIRRGGQLRNGWFEGVLLQRNFGATSFLGAELYHQDADHVGGGASSGFDVGGSLLCRRAASCCGLWGAISRTSPPTACPTTSRFIGCFEAGSSGAWAVLPIG